MPKIRVHERALAHLSRGLYRSPASALRELVSNAWDANATRVVIDTNYPKFFQLSIEDNGDGFSRDDFATLMEGGIGNSSKRTEYQPLKYDRPTIGRLGIGMLGIAQICGSFVVTSKPISGEPFRARVILYDSAKQQMDDPDSRIVHSATTAITDEGEIRSQIVEVGTFEFEDFDLDRFQRGTRILADDVQPTFTRAFQDTLSKSVPRDWRLAVTRTLAKTGSLQELGDYWRLLWELAVACPVPYFADDAIPEGAVARLNETLRSYNFSVFVDGRQLYKTISLKGNPGGYTIRKIQKTSLTVYGTKLAFGGYILVQEGKQLKPDELRGLLIRINNVGIGYYDPSMLDYRYNEGPRSRWVTGELYIEDGLEDALNVDRDSFNRFHPEFRELQSRVHEILRRDVFPQVYRNIDVRSTERQKTIAAKRTRALNEAVAAHQDRPVRIALRRVSSDAGESFSGAHETSRQIEVQVARADDLPVPRSAQQISRSVLAIFEIAMLEKDDAECRRVFTELLVDLMKRW
jgi:hypothetical protein